MLRNLYPSLIVFALAIGGSYVWLQTDRNSPTATDFAVIETLVDVTDVQATDADTLEVPEMTLGDADAPVTIIEYASFTCPHCARFHETVFKDIVTNYVDTGKVQFIMRDVYFDRLGLWAAMLARCEPAKFFGFSDLIYTRQSDWTRADSDVAVVQNLKTLGRIAGMTDDVMDACLQDSTTAQALVNAYQTNSERDDITSTPSFLINGKKYANMNYADFAEAIDSLIAE
ncbi:MAG: protein-disulfide isomerase [Paracoccaceae bacterium]|jgi:protein-disulfide isomerase